MPHHETLQLLEERRSLRLFSDAPITQEVREALIQATLRAPSAGNLMNYSIIEVTNQEIKDRLAITCDHQPMIARAPLVWVFLADLHRLYDYFTQCDVPKLCERESREFHTPAEGEFLLAANDAIVAAQNAVVAAEALGMGSCYIGDIIENVEIHRELLDFPPWCFPVTMLIAGYPKKAPKGPKTPRIDQEFVVHNNRYKRLTPEELKQLYAKNEEHLSARYIKGAENFGQHLYLKKIGTDFAVELTRSFRKGLKEWCDGQVTRT
ncbi:MAG: nitroreductase family protein [Spirochaetales bacterium]|nr:nitroreductase family protein [Spirochaetales bacterium]